MRAIQDLQRRLSAVENLSEIQRLSGVSYRQLLRIRKGEGSTTLRLYERIDAAIKVASLRSDKRRAA